MWFVPVQLSLPVTQLKVVEQDAQIEDGVSLCLGIKGDIVIPGSPAIRDPTRGIQLHIVLDGNMTGESQVDFEGHVVKGDAVSALKIEFWLVL